MNFAYKIWIEDEDESKAVFGVGVYQLLMLVRQTGSLKRAAENLKMSYRWAWSRVRDCETQLGIKLLEKGRHGRRGAHLTDGGNEIIDQFHKILDEIDSVISEGSLKELLAEIKHLKSAS
jgi:molybdate transport system regulatory protein